MGTETEKPSAPQRYDNLNGLRSIAAVCIVLMHVFYNGAYDVSGAAFDVIETLAVFVALFFMISGFGICCGYYERIKNNQISLNEFYSNRYKRILPYFSLLVLADMLMSWNGINNLIEGFVQISLWGGFLPFKSITVLGVGWTLGVTFVFYMLFPFVVFLLWNKKRAWGALVLTTALAYICRYYFGTEDNFIYFFFYFVAGGVLYLYKDALRQWLQGKQYLMRVLACLAALAWNLQFKSVMLPLGEGAVEISLDLLVRLLIFSVWMLYAMGAKEALLDNPITKFISGISMEIYLAHMAIFRVIERMGFAYISSNPLVSYLVAFVLTLGGVIVFAVVYQRVVLYIKIKWLQKEKKLLT